MELTTRSISYQPAETAPTTFPDWASQEIERLMSARQSVQDPQERAQIDLQLAVVCDAARRYGHSLVEAAEL